MSLDIITYIVYLILICVIARLHVYKSTSTFVGFGFCSFNHKLSEISRMKEALYTRGCSFVPDANGAACFAAGKRQ